MSIYWGVVPLKSMQFSTTDDICNGAIELALVKQYVEPGDVVVLTAGIPSSNILQERTSSSNMMEDCYGGIKSGSSWGKYKKEKNYNEQKAICDKRTGGGNCKNISHSPFICTMKKGSGKM